jgi:hypothetical protein
MANDRQEQSLRGPVKSVDVETAEFEEQEGQLVEKPWFSHGMSFDQDGRIIESIVRNPDGSTWRTRNEYSDSGKLIATRSYDSSDQLSSQLLSMYDPEGRLIAEQNIAHDGRVTTPTTYDHDSDGQKTKTEMLDFPGDANMMIGIEGTNTVISAHQAKRIQTRYNQQSYAVEVKAYDADGALVRRVEITRDAHGNPLEETQYTGDTVSFEQCSSSSCSIEAEPSLTKEQRAEFAAEIARMFTPGTAISKHIHRYDEEGRLIESKLTMMGMIASHQVFKYDRAGNKSEEEVYDGYGALRTRGVFTREYDEQGNWTTEVVSTAFSSDLEVSLSTPCNVTRRRITYY